jgi:hypothetical protein
LIVRRVKDKNVAPDQGELFTAWRYHAFITDSTLQLVAAEKQHRQHAIIEQVNADLKDSALAHMPSGSFAANAAWLTLAAIAHNLTRAAGCLASLFHAKARTGTLRRYLITRPARIARRSRHITLRLPINWPHSRRLHQPVHHHPRPTTHNLNSTNTASPGPTGAITVEKLDRPAVSAHPQPHTMIHNAEHNPEMITQGQPMDPGLRSVSPSAIDGICAAQRGHC